MFRSTLIASVLFLSAAAAASEGIDISAFFMPRAEEIAIARSAAPAKVSERATIMVLAKDGYEIAVKGSNSFVCLVIRSFGNPTHDHEYMYMPGIVVPECLDENAAKTILPVQLHRAELAVRKTPPHEIEAAVRGGFQSGRFQRVETVAFSYMMSEAMTFGGGQRGPAHVMIYLPDDYTNDMIGGFSFKERFVIVEGGPDQPFVAANVYLPDKAIAVKKPE